MQLTIRIYLMLLGILYVALGLWCSISPVSTSAKVGFRLQGDSGTNEFITVYGGLEFALGILFLMPLLNSDLTRWSLLLCLVVHGSLVLFRSLAFLSYSDVQPMTIRLAAGEWGILIATAVFWYLSGKPDAVPVS